MTSNNRRGVACFVSLPIDWDVGIDVCMVRYILLLVDKLRYYVRAS